MPAFRSPVALSDALTRDLRFRFRLSLLVGAGALAVVWLFNGFPVPGSAPEAADAIAGAAAFVVVTLGGYAALNLASPRERRVLGTTWWIAGESARRAREAFGDPRIPATPKQALAWLARHPDDTDATRGTRIFACLVIGDLEAARALQQRLPSDTSLKAFKREAAATMLRFVEGGDPPVPRLRELALSLLDDDDRLQAEVDTGLLEALLAASDGGDWRARILALRDRIGPRADRALLLLVPAHVPLVAATLVAGALITLIAYALRALLAG